MPPVRQSSFTGGVLAPGLWGRTNLKTYASALRTGLNMIPRQEGPVSNRPGTIFEEPIKEVAGNVRIVPFIFSSGTLSQAFMLEVGPEYIRFWKDGRVIRVGLVPVEIVTAYASDEIPRLKFAQSGQVVTVTCKRRRTMELTWINDTTWQWSPFSIAREIAPPTFVMVSSSSPGDATVAAKKWQWVVTAVRADSKIESLPSGYAEAECALSTNKPALITWTPSAGAGEYNVYRGRNGKYGFVGTAVGGAMFWDDGQGPVYAETPPINRDPFPTDDDQPQVVTYHDQRLVMANAWNAPAELEMSRISDYHNFDRAAPPKDTDAVTINIVGDQYEEIRAMKSVREGLLVLTNGTEYLISGTEGAVTQNDVALVTRSHWGSSWLDPIIIGEDVLFVQDVGSTIRGFRPGEAEPGDDLTLLAQHLFQGYEIKSWGYAHEPFRLVWAVRDDGRLLSLTYVKQHDVAAWAEHDTGDGDRFEDVCVLPAPKENVVYLLVARTIGGQSRRYVERLAPRVNQTWEEGIFLDSAVTARNVQVVTGLGHLEGRTVYALADGLPRGPFTVAGGQIALPVAAAVVHVGLRVHARSSTLDMFSTDEEIRPHRKMIKKVFAEVLDSAPFTAGQAFDGPLRSARLPDGQKWMPGLYTGLVEIQLESTWRDDGRVVWEQLDPLPLTILSITREVEFGGY